MVERTVEQIIAAPQYRMYCMVLYSLSGIQKGIQAAHAIVEYAAMASLSERDARLGIQEEVSGHTFDEAYRQWADVDKTIIVLDGGTSNHIDPMYTGTMETNMRHLGSIGVRYAMFREPDANHATTAVCFLVSEKVCGSHIVDFKPRPDAFPDEVLEDKRKWLATYCLSEEESEYRLWLKSFRLAASG